MEVEDVVVVSVYTGSFHVFKCIMASLIKRLSVGALKRFGKHLQTGGVLIYVSIFLKLRML